MHEVYIHFIDGASIRFVQPRGLGARRSGKNATSKIPTREGACSEHMGDLKKEAEKFVKQAEGGSKKGSGGSKESNKKGKGSGSGSGSGADKAKRAAKEVLK